MDNVMSKVLGPRPPRDLTPKQRFQYMLPNIFMGLAVICLIASIFLPYWTMTLEAPQYPDGLEIQVYVNKVVGDTAELQGLNHYIGMRSLEEAGQLERSLSFLAITGIALLVIAATFLHNPCAAILSLPAALTPIVFLADLYYWLRNFGLNLDPRAPLSSSVDPFVPVILGEGKVAQFKTAAWVAEGWYLALAASVLIVAGLYFHRRAYKPLFIRGLYRPVFEHVGLVKRRQEA
jgi:hypothetical protein